MRLSMPSPSVLSSADLQGLCLTLSTAITWVPFLAQHGFSPARQDAYLVTSIAWLSLYSMCLAALAQQPAGSSSTRLRPPAQHAESELSMHIAGNRVLGDVCLFNMELHSAVAASCCYWFCCFSASVQLHLMCHHLPCNEGINCRHDFNLYTCCQVAVQNS
jgi:hypothetical protein